jgi:hypothetical protein
MGRGHGEYMHGLGTRGLPSRHGKSRQQATTMRQASLPSSPPLQVYTG